MSFNFPPKKGKEQISCWKFTYKVPHSGDIILRHAIVSSAWGFFFFFRSPSQAKERAGVFGAGVGPAGDPLVLQVQHFCGTGPVCGAAPLELWHPPQRGRSHRLGDRGPGRSEDFLSSYIFCPSVGGTFGIWVLLRGLGLARPSAAPRAAAGT